MGWFEDFNGIGGHSAQGRNTLGASVGNKRTMLRTGGETMNEAADGAEYPTLPVDPFFAKAEAEAFDDQLCGITRSHEWIVKRAKEIADEDFSKPAEDKTRIGLDYFRIENIAHAMRMGTEHSLPTIHAQKNFNEWMNDHEAKIIEKFKSTYTPEDLLKKQILADNEIVLKAEKRKIHNDSVETTRMTLTLIKSSFFCFMIPVCGMLPKPYDSFAFLPLLYVIYLNWPAFRKLSKLTKEIREKQKQEEREKQGDVNYDPAQ
jgi:hypothetical protein